jgi:hypothetical protein
MSRSQGSASSSRWMAVHASTTSRVIGCSITVEDASSIVRSRTRSSVVTASVVWVTYQRSMSVATETTMPSLSSASTSTSAAAEESRDEPPVYQTIA